MQAILDSRPFVLLSRGRVGKWFIPLACVALIASYVFGEASSWASFGILSLVCVAVAVLALGWVDRFVLRLLMRNFEWMFLALHHCALCDDRLLADIGQRRASPLANVELGYCFFSIIYWAWLMDAKTQHVAICVYSIGCMCVFSN